jgi:hypothetical protein
MKVWSGSAWAEKPAKVWSGSAWVTKPVKVWDGSAWVVKPAAGGAITAPVFRSKTNTSYPGSAGMIYLTKPTGTVENDILVATIVHVKAAPAQNDLVPDVAWNKIGTSTIATGSLVAKLETWWRRATASEPATYGFDVWGSSNHQGYIAAYSGCPTSGSPVDVFSQNSANTGNTATGTGVTTTQANDLLLYHGHNWDGTGTLNPPTGMTERMDILVYAADQVIAAAGATGNRTQTLASSNPWAVYMVALKGAGGAGPTAPTSSLLTAYTPGTDRNDFTGEVGVRLGIGASPFTVSWVGARRHSSAQTGTHTVKLYEWFGSTVERTAIIDYTGVAVGSYAWTAITPITLTAGGYYALLMVVTAFDGQTWCNPGAATYTGMANVYDSYYAGGLQTGGAGSAFIGLDLGW